MGTWGTSLYANDSTSDIRGEYVDKLRRGKSNEEVTKELIEQNQDSMGDVEEEPLFWYADGFCRRSRRRRCIFWTRQRSWNAGGKPERRNCGRGKIRWTSSGRSCRRNRRRRKRFQNTGSISVNGSSGTCMLTGSAVNSAG